MSKLKIFNGPAPTTAAQASVATGTAIKTLLQLKATKGLIITGWGYSLDTAQAAAGTMELVKTGLISATVTAFVSGDVVALSTPSAPTSLTLGTASSGYTASAEGTITAATVFDATKLSVSTTAAPTALYVRSFGKDERPYLPPGQVLRVRSTTGTSAGAIAWISWLEN